MTTEINSSIATQSGTRPQLLAFLRTLVQQSHDTPTESTLVTDTDTLTDPTPHPLAGSWQDAWIISHSQNSTSPLIGLIVLHPIATAVRAVRVNGQWDIPKPEHNINAKRVVVNNENYEVVVESGPIVPINVFDSNEGWIVSGSTDPWGHSVSPRLRAILDSFTHSDGGWVPVYSTCLASELASSITFGPYNDRFATYSEAVAATPSDGFVLSLAVESLSAEIEALGFGSPVLVDTNFPSTHRPMTRAGRTSK
jgi:hypothetical protein